MSEILELVPKYLSKEWSVDRFSRTYKGYCKALTMGDYLFNMLERIFSNICKEISLQRSIFRLRGESADELFSQTLEWIFPMPFESSLEDPFSNEEEDDEEDKEYGLIWDGKDRNYKYMIEVTVLAEIFENSCPEADDIECSGKIFREDKAGYLEFWCSSEQRWRECRSPIVEARFHAEPRRKYW